MERNVLTARGLRKRYRGRRGVLANDGVDLDVRSGDVVGLLGHNGAGKTTFVNQVVGLVRPDEGIIRLDGMDVVAAPQLARKLTCVQAQANVPISGLTPRVAIGLVGRIRGLAKKAADRRADELLDALDLGQWADVPAHKVSGGVARLTAFAMTAVAPGRLVILDEPTNDVDPVRRRLLWSRIRGLADEGRGVLLVTHNVVEAERVVDRLAVLDLGRVVAAGTPAELTAPLRDHLVFDVETADDALAWHPAATPTRRDRLHRSATVASADVPAVVEWAQAQVAAGRIERYALEPASLEEAYVRLVGGDRASSTVGQRPATDAGRTPADHLIEEPRP